MTPSPVKNPTDAELRILHVLWRHGPCTVRDVHTELSREGALVGYTTILKLMQIMAEKGLVVRDDSARAHIFRAVPSEETAQNSLMNDLLKRAFDGSAQKLVMHALETHKASPEDRAEIRRLLDALERENT